MILARAEGDERALEVLVSGLEEWVLFVGLPVCGQAACPSRSRLIVGMGSCAQLFRNVVWQYAATELQKQVGSQV